MVVYDHQTDWFLQQRTLQTPFKVLVAANWKPSKEQTIFFQKSRDISDTFESVIGFVASAQIRLPRTRIMCCIRLEPMIFCNDKQFPLSIVSWQSVTDVSPQVLQNKNRNWQFLLCAKNEWKPPPSRTVLWPHSDLLPAKKEHMFTCESSSRNSDPDPRSLQS